MSEGEPRPPSFEPPPPQDDEPEAQPLDVVPAAEKLPEHEGFLQAIEQNPDDDDPKLIYADWLEERGSVLGEFIRVETALKNLPADDPQREALTRRSQAIREQVGNVEATVFLADTELLPRFKVEIPKNTTLEELIAGGGYHAVNPDINSEHFPLIERGTFTVALMHFGKQMTSSDEVIQAIGRTRHYQPAKTEHLVAYGNATHPNEQLVFLVAAPGSDWIDQSGRHNVPCHLEWAGPGFNPDGHALDWQRYEWWRDYDRFLLVREQKPS